MYLTRVKDIIIPLKNYPHFTEETTLSQVIDEMEKVQIVSKDRNSLPRVALVFTRDGQTLLGLVRRRDILRGLLPDYLKTSSLDYDRKFFDIAADPNLAEVTTDRMVQIMRDQSGRKVREVMVAIKATIDVEDSVIKAIHLMVGENTSLLPATDGGRVVGVVRSVDVMHVVARALR